MNFGLERIGQALARLNNPQDKIKSIHIAGTNGKGSTASFISHILVESGCYKKVGRFNSPHLRHPRDSITLSNIPLSLEKYNLYKTEIKKIINDCSEFEKLTVLAFYTFFKENCDIMVIECGLGGLFDATNILKCPIVCVITSIGFDHMNILGQEIENITQHKCGIIKPGSKVVIAPQKYPKVIEFVKSNIKPKYTNNDFIFVERIKNLKLSLEGEHQLDNASTAIKAIHALNNPLITEEIIEKGLLATKWEGRTEWIKMKNGENILIDGAHNEDAAVVLRDYIDDSIGREMPVHWIFGFTKGKDFQKIIKILTKPKDKISLLQFSQPEGMPWISCETDIEQDLIDECQLIYQPVENFREIFSKLQSNYNYQIVVTGSLYLIADFKRFLDQWEQSPGLSPADI